MTENCLSVSKMLTDGSSTPPHPSPSIHTHTHSYAHTMVDKESPHSKCNKLGYGPLETGGHVPVALRAVDLHVLTKHQHVQGTHQAKHVRLKHTIKPTCIQTGTGAEL